MPAINYYIPEDKYTKLIFKCVERNEELHTCNPEKQVKLKHLIDEALDEWFDKQEGNV